MSPASSGGTWEEAASPTAVQLARRFEAAWRASKGKGRAPAVKGQPKPYKKRQGR